MECEKNSCYFNENKAEMFWKDSWELKRISNDLGKGKTTMKFGRHLQIFSLIQLHLKLKIIGNESQVLLMPEDDTKFQPVSSKGLGPTSKDWCINEYLNILCHNTMFKVNMHCFITSYFEQLFSIYQQTICAKWIGYNFNLLLQWENKWIISSITVSKS